MLKAMRFLLGLKKITFTKEEVAAILMWIAIPACMMSGTGFFISIMFCIFAIGIVWDKIIRINIPRFIWIAWVIIFLSSLYHLGWHRNLDQLAGTFLIVTLLLLINIPRATDSKILILMPFVAIIEVVAFLILKPLGLGHYDGFITDCSHLSVFMILFGVLVISSYRIKFIALCLAYPALILSGSEEGLFFLFALTAFTLIRRDYNWKWAVPVTLAVITLAISFYTGLFDDLYPALTGERITSGDPQQVLHGRWDDYERAIDTIKYEFGIFGTGWQWDISGTVPHNVPILISTQYGIPAALAWLALMFYGIFKTKHKYIFLLLLSISVIEHYPWTFMMIIPFLLLGFREGNDLIYRKEVHKQCEMPVQSRETCPIS